MMTESADRLRGKRVLCAVSGGADSMCLLSLLHSRNVELCAAHFEHGIRGEESLRDARFVEQWCAERGIKCLVGHADVPAYAKENGLSTETAARKLRYAFLESAAKELGCDVIATAHNADDNAETLIFNLTRGTGNTGLRGIPKVRGNIVRPLIDVTRAEIEEYLRENGIEHVEDSTNAEDKYSRNLIRHRVIPVLRAINPAFSRAAARTAELAERDEDCLSAMADEFMEKYFRAGSLPARELRALHPAVASRVIRKFIGRSISMEHAEMILALTETSERGYADIPGARISCEKGRLYLPEDKEVRIQDRKLIPGETLIIPEIGLEILSKEIVFGEEINGLFKTYYFRCENICHDILVTGRRPGDKYRPLGRGCTKSLKSLFLEKRFTEREKNSVPVIRDAEGILAVIGFGVDERMSCSPGDRVIELKINYLGEENDKRY